VPLLIKVERIVVMFGVSVIESAITFSSPNQKESGAGNIFPSHYHVRPELTEIKIRLPKGIVGSRILVLIYPISIAVDCRR